MLRRPAVALRLWLLVAAAWVAAHCSSSGVQRTVAASAPAAAASPASSADSDSASSSDEPVPGFLDLFLPGLNSSESHAQDLGWHRARGSTSSTIRPCWLGDVFPGRIMQLELWAESHYATPVWLDPGELETLLLLRADNPYDVLSLLMHDELGSPTVSDPVAINDAAVRAYRKRNHMFTITLQHHQRLQPKQKRHIGVLTIRIPPPTNRQPIGAPIGVFPPSPPPLTYMSSLRYDWLQMMETRVAAFNKALAASPGQVVHRDPVTRMPMVPLSVVPANVLQVLFPYVSPLFVGALHLPKEDIVLLNQSVHLWQQFVNPRVARPEQFIRPAPSSVLFNQTLTLTPRNLHYSEHSSVAPLRLNPSRLHFFGNYVPRPHIVSGWYDESLLPGSPKISLTAPTAPPPPMHPGEVPHIVDFGLVELGNYKELCLHFSHPLHFDVHELVQEGNVRRARPRSERNRDKLGDNIHAERDPAQSPIVLEALEVTLEYSHEELQPLPPVPLRSDPSFSPHSLRETKRPPSAGKPIKVLAKHNPFTFELLQTPEYKAVESSELIKFARIIPFEKRNVSTSNAQRKATPPIPYTLYRLIFSPTAAGAFESVFVVRNNLTCVEMVVLRGWSARGSLTFRRTRFPILKEYNDAAMELIRKQELDPSIPLPPIGRYHFQDLATTTPTTVVPSTLPSASADGSKKESSFPWRAYGARFMDEAPGLEVGVVVGNKASAPPLENLYNDPSAHLLFHTSSSAASGLSPPSVSTEGATLPGSNFPRLVLDLVEYCRFFYGVQNEVELDNMLHLSSDRQELLLNEDVKPVRFDRWEPDLLTRVVWENSASPVEPFGVSNDGPVGFYLVAVSVGPQVSLSQSRTRAHIPRRAPISKPVAVTVQTGPSASPKAAGGSQGSNAGTTGGGVPFGDPNVLLNGGKYALPLKHLNLCDRFNSIPSPHHFAFNGCSQLPIYFPPGHHQWFFLSYPLLAILVPDVMRNWLATHPRESSHVLFLHLHTTTGIFSLPLELQLPAFLSNRMLLPWDEDADLYTRSTLNEKARAEAMIKTITSAREQAQQQTAASASNAASVASSSSPSSSARGVPLAAVNYAPVWLRLLSYFLSFIIYSGSGYLLLHFSNWALTYRNGPRPLSYTVARFSRLAMATWIVWRKRIAVVIEARNAAAAAAASTAKQETAAEVPPAVPAVAVAAVAASPAAKSAQKKGKKSKSAHANHVSSSSSAAAVSSSATDAAAAADDDATDADLAAAAPAESPGASEDAAVPDADLTSAAAAGNGKKENKKQKKKKANAAAAAEPPAAPVKPQSSSPTPANGVLESESTSPPSKGRKTPLPLVFPHMLPPNSPEVHVVHRKVSAEDIALAAKTRPVAAHSEAAIRLLTFGSKDKDTSSHATTNNAASEDERKQPQINGKKGAKNGHVLPVIPAVSANGKDDASSTTSSAATTSTPSPVHTPVASAGPPAGIVEVDVWPVSLNTTKKTKSAPVVVASPPPPAATPPDPSPSVSPGVSARGSPRTVESYGAVAAGRTTAKVVRMHAALTNLNATAPRTVSATLQASAEKRQAPAKQPAKAAPEPKISPVTAAPPVAAAVVKPTVATPMPSPPRKQQPQQPQQSPQPQQPQSQPQPQASMVVSPQRVVRPVSPPHHSPVHVAPLAVAPAVIAPVLRTVPPPPTAQELALQQTLLMVQQQQQRAAQEAALRQQQERAYAQQRPMQSYSHQQQPQSYGYQHPTRPYLTSSAPIDSYQSSFNPRAPSSTVAASGGAPSNLASVFHRGVGVVEGSGSVNSASNSPPVSSRPHAFSDPELNFGGHVPQHAGGHAGAFELGNPARSPYDNSYDSLFHSPPAGQLHASQPRQQHSYPQSMLRYDAAAYTPSADLPPSLFSFMHTDAQSPSHSHSSPMYATQPLHSHPVSSPSHLSHSHRAASASPVAVAPSASASSASYLQHSSFYGSSGAVGSMALSQEQLRRDLSYDDEESAEDLRMLQTLNQTSSTQSISRRLISYDSNSPPLTSAHHPHAPLSPAASNALLATPPLVPSFLINPTQDDK